MKKQNIPTELADLLLQIPEERQSELLAQWTWQMVLAKEQLRNMRSTAVLSGLFALLGVVLGVVLGVAASRLL